MAGVEKVGRMSNGDEHAVRIRCERAHHCTAIDGSRRAGSCAGLRLVIRKHPAIDLTLK